jgi:CheY-like chemotaxis protein
MSHKLRTPLNAVLGFTQLLLAEDDGGDASARRHKLERVHAAGQQLLALVDDALELSGIQPGAAGPAVLRDTAANEVRQPDTSPGVLYIEDNPVNMLLVRELVRQRPHLEFHGAVDGASGIALARTLQPLLVLIDMQLPDGDGLAVLRQLRADPATRHLTCVALSANAIAEDVQRARDAGFADYWTKPIDLAKFLIELDRLVPGASAGTA